MPRHFSHPTLLITSLILFKISRKPPVWGKTRKIGMRKLGEPFGVQVQRKSPSPVNVQSEEKLNKQTTAVTHSDGEMREEDMRKKPKRDDGGMFVENRKEGRRKDDGTCCSAMRRQRRRTFTLTRQIPSANKQLHREGGSFHLSTPIIPFSLALIMHQTLSSDPSPCH